MSTAPFPYRRRIPARHIRGIGDGGDPQRIGPNVLAPWDPAAQDGGAPQDLTDLVQMDQTQIDHTAAAGRPDLPPWIYQPTNWENIDQANYVLVPAIGSTATIISYVVPPGRNGVINKIANNFVGGGWVEGSADILWRILIDGTPPPGATSYDAIVNSLGNPSSPTGIAGFRIFENQVLTFVAFNNPAGANGGVLVSGQLVGARFLGWNYPTDIEEENIWI